MKPKLIVLNGPCGIGKSTLAKRYGDNHPLCLVLDIDNVWSMISQWREQKEVSAPLSKKIAYEMARIALTDGHDVIVPQIIQHAELASNLRTIADSCNADYVEVLLDVDKDEAIHRFVKRGQAQGHPSGFRPGGILEAGGGEKKLAEMYDNMITALAGRSDVIRIKSQLDEVESTYKNSATAVDIQ